MPAKLVTIQHATKSIIPFVELLKQGILFKEEVRMILGYEEVKFYSQDKLSRLYVYISSDPTFVNNLCTLVDNKVITDDEAREQLGVPSIKETKTKLKNLLKYAKHDANKRDKKQKV